MDGRWHSEKRMLRERVGELTVIAAHPHGMIISELVSFGE
jgi:hypothetical protein